ncbi:hypothetical protein ECG_09255 [Echinococcus granulosus]|nr:hypothetical protein ECG_09255 [Echinococcus granulosus]
MHCRDHLDECRLKSRLAETSTQVVCVWADLGVQLETFYAHSAPMRSTLMMGDGEVLRGLVQCGKRKLSSLSADGSGRLLRRTLLRQSLKTWRRQQREIRRQARFERRNWRSFYRAWEEEDDFEDCEELHEIQVHNPELAAAFAALDNGGGRPDPWPGVVRPGLAYLGLVDGALCACVISRLMRRGDLLRYLTDRGLVKLSSLNPRNTPDILLRCVLLNQSLKSWREQLVALRVEDNVITNNANAIGIREDNGNAQSQNFESALEFTGDGSTNEVVSVHLIPHSDNDSPQNCSD